MLLIFGAMNMQMIARGWFMYELTNSGLLLGLQGAATGVPMLLLALFGGTLADRLPKRRILTACQAAMAAGSLVIALLIWSGGILWWHLILASTLQGSVFAFMMPTRQAMISELVTPRLLFNAISLNAGTMNANRVIMPAVAGFLIAGLGVASVYFVMAALYVLSLVVLLFLRATSPTVPVRRMTIVGEMRQTFGYVSHRRHILSLLAIAFVTVVFGLPFQHLLPMFTADVFNAGSEGLGILISLMGVGALTGSILTASLGDYQRKGLLLIVLTTVFGIGLLVFSFSSIFLLSLVLIVPVGIGQSARQTVNTTLVQANVDSEMRGRVMSLLMMEVGLQPLGLLPISAAADIVGAPVVIAFCGTVISAYCVWAFLFQPAVRYAR